MIMTEMIRNIIVINVRDIPTIPSTSVATGLEQLLPLLIKVLIEEIPNISGKTVRAMLPIKNNGYAVGISAAKIKVKYEIITPPTPVKRAARALPKPYIRFWGSGIAFSFCTTGAASAGFTVSLVRCAAHSGQSVPSSICFPQLIQYIFYLL
jgi:hypothetical protein